MKGQNPDELQRQIEALQERVSKLCGAVLRIGATLDLDTVLQEVVDSARALTGARHGVITTVDEAGRPQEFVGSGITPDEYRQLAEWADGLSLFEHLRDLPGVLRIADLPSYLRSLGFPTDVLPYKTLQGTPMRHRDVHVGSFFLTEKEGGREFTSEDEEVLVLFASQAASAIVNARTYRDEQRARADLEALVDTSPVGVVVFDAKTGALASLNREAKRIVEGLRTPDRSMEELLRGRDLPARRRPGDRPGRVPAGAAAEQCRDGARRGDRALGPRRPQREDADQRHADPCGRRRGRLGRGHDAGPGAARGAGTGCGPAFLRMVSHELRSPLVSIKGSAATVLDASQSPAPTEMLQFFRVISEQADQMHGLIGDLLDQGHIETGTLSVLPEPAEVVRLVDQARNTFQSGGGRHNVRVDLPEDLPRVMADGHRIVQVLNNLFANAARAAPESSPISVAAVRDGVHVAISVADQGRGVSPDELPHLFRKHADVPAGDRGGGSGFGLGLVICKGLVEAHGGRVWAESAGVGRGTRFVFTLPVADEAAADRRRARSTVKRASGRTPVLVVDDDAEMLRYVRDALRRGATHRSRRATRRRCPASSGRTSRGWSCWTCCCPIPTVSS